MKPSIDRTAFGSITIDGEVFEHDVLIRLNGPVKKWQNKLSTGVFGPSHIISLDEAPTSTKKGRTGSSSARGSMATVRLSAAAAEYFSEKVPGGVAACARGDPGQERGGGGCDRTITRHVLSHRSPQRGISQVCLEGYVRLHLSGG